MTKSGYGRNPSCEFQRTPMICIPIAGSPWKGTDVSRISCLMSLMESDHINNGSPESIIPDLIYQRIHSGKWIPVRTGRIHSLNSFLLFFNKDKIHLEIAPFMEF